MSNNNYDTFAISRAKEFANKQNFTHAYIEKPTMYALLPDLHDKQVLCIGCGTGEECLELKKRGAEVIGFDNSPSSIGYARKRIDGVVFNVANMDDTSTYGSFTPEQFDLVYSSLTFHYSDDLGSLLQKVHQLLKPGGQLLFSVGHPLRWAAEATGDKEAMTVLMGYKKGMSAIKVWGNYLETRRFTQQLADGPEITYWMRPISSYFDILTESGFTLQAFKEPSPVQEAKGIDPNLYELRSKMPVGMIFLARKPAN